eukprot:6875984-Pyramimonas_sp.AAC.1
MFVGQLDVLPDTFEDHEARACAALMPGPGGWMSPRCLRRLRGVGFPVELPDLRARCVAAKARACLFENRQQGGLRVQERSVRLQRAIAAAAGQLSTRTWRSWLDNLFLFQLAHAEAALKA